MLYTYFIKQNKTHIWRTFPPLLFVAYSHYVRVAAKKIFLNGNAIKRDGGGVKGLPLRKNNFFGEIFLICLKNSDRHKLKGGG